MRAQRFTTLCVNALRNVDIFGRWGGEEFVALLPETDIDGAAVIGERLRKIVADSVLNYHDNKINFTVSVGVAQYKDSESSIDGPLQPRRQRGLRREKRREETGFRSSAIKSSKHITDGHG